MWEIPFFEKNDIHKFTWVSRVDGCISLLDLTGVQEEDRNKLLDVNVFRGTGGGLLDPHLVVAKIRWLRR